MTRMVQSVSTTFLAGGLHTERALLRPIPGQVQAMLRAAGPLATPFAVCQAVGIGAG